MKIHLLVMQTNGDFTDRQEIDSATIRSWAPARAVVERCHEILHDHLPAQFTGAFKFTATIGRQPSITIHWHQIDPFSAGALLQVDDEPAGQVWVLTGCQPNCDRMAVEMMVDCQMAMTERSPVSPGPALRSVNERPVAIGIPLPTEADRRHARMVGNVVAAIAFAETTVDFKHRLREAAKRHPAFSRVRPPGGFSRD